MKKDPSKWFTYMDIYDKDCSITKGFAECSENTMKELGLPVEEINKQVKDEIQKSKTVAEGTILMEWVESASRGNILFYPDVSINNINYQGELLAPDIFEMVCNSLVNMPSACLSTPPEPSIIPIPQGSLLPTIALIIVLMTVGFFLLVVVYRRVIRREMQQEMSTQVNQMVSQYIAFYDKK